MKNVILLVFLMTLLVVSSCKKDEDNPDDTAYTALVFDTLYASPDTVGIGGQTQVHAVATGTGMVFSWSCSLGTFVGSGAEVTFIASPCMYGPYNINCIVKDTKGIEKSGTCQVVIQ